MSDEACRCATCRYWGAEGTLALPAQGRHNVPTTWRACGARALFGPLTSWQEATPPLYPMGIYEPGEDADLFTAPEFGCVQHEPRTTRRE